MSGLLIDFLGFSLLRFIRGATYFERGRKYLRRAGVLLEIVGTIGDYNSIGITSSLKKFGSVHKECPRFGGWESSIFIFKKPYKCPRWKGIQNFNELILQGLRLIPFQPH